MQWLHDDGSWVSYDPLHTPALEKAYRRFITKADKPSRAFIELNIGHGTFRYQFDFQEPIVAPQVAADAPPDNPLCSVVGTQTNLRTMRARGIRRCTAARSPELACAHSASHALDETSRAELVLEAMRVLTRELEVCVMAIPLPKSGVTPDISINDLSDMQSSLLSALCQASKSSARQGWNELASEVPSLLDFKTRMSLVRKASCTTAEDLESIKKDRVNGVERSRILEWAAAIASAQLKQGRRNPLAITVIFNEQFLFYFMHFALSLIIFESVQHKWRP
jgi:hypothetical protein